jgi:hypothetical protein
VLDAAADLAIIVLFHDHLERYSLAVSPDRSPAEPGVQTCDLRPVAGPALGAWDATRPRCDRDQVGRP